VGSNPTLSAIKSCPVQLGLTGYRRRARADEALNKMMKGCETLKSIALILSTLAVILPGCAAVHTDYLMLDTQTCHKAGIPIDLYYVQPQFPYTKVAKIEAIKNRLRRATWEDVKLALCREAYELDLDIDGLIGVQESSVSTDETLGPIGTGGESEKLTAIAIRYDKSAE
jgi:hypothetical protein